MLVKVTVLLVVLLVAHRSLAAHKSSPIPGGFFDVDLNDPEVLRLAKEAVQIHAKETGDKLKLHQVLAAKKQFVAGVNYRIYLEARNLNPRRIPVLLQLQDRVHVPLKGKASHHVTEITN
ncbi:unnamed protein product [Bursaphelenchus xylophilus]|uniref:(pine wood nematode) hypothetical protein n=1 Tax=Bursaphelenchus xylophilus TaxID=6326 RepID=A0A1I7SQY0_BURXY|nr:unnamed protein product [Bursaphelenchus xylophilus]CAG9110548.1 unnamed protein product [Bursaphelenchus xylophilus]